MASRGGFGNFSHRAPVLSTDMRCYFGCNEAFKKDIDIHLHLKLRHRHENENELRKAYQAAEEEIALTSSSASKFQCALCPKVFNNHNGFYGHIVKREHKMAWLDYKEKYGNCEVESAPFECKICGRVIKYVRNSITNHLRVVHQINWPLYVERIRKMRDGEMPKELPSIDLFQCKICSTSVKFMSRGNHLQGVHKITESEYIELFKDDLGTEDAQNAIAPKRTLSGGTKQLDRQNTSFDSSYSTMNFENNQRTPPTLATNDTPYNYQPRGDFNENYSSKPLNTHSNKNNASIFDTPRNLNQQTYARDEAEDSLDECSDEEQP